MPLDCWVNGLMQSHYFLCCVTSDELTKDGVLMPDCWENGWAEKSREACCNTDAFEHMDVRAMSLTKGSTECFFVHSNKFFLLCGLIDPKIDIFKVKSESRD